MALAFPSSSMPSSHSSQWIIAVGMSLGATLINNVGMLHMKASMMENSLTRIQRPAWKQLRWLLGFIAYIVGQIFAMVSLGFGPQSMMAALGAFSLVVNVFTSPCILGEVVTCFHIGSTFVIIFGVIIVVSFSKKKAQHYTIEELEGRFQQTPFLITGATMGVLLVIMFFRYGPLRCCNNKEELLEKERGTAAAQEGTTRQEIEKGEKREVKGKEENAEESMDLVAAGGLPPICCAFVASICSASTNLCAKCTMSILMAHGPEVWYTSVVAWVIILGLVTTAVGTVVFLNLGLNSKNGALFIIPVFFVMVLLSTTLVAAVFFGDFDSLPMFHILMLALGAVFTLMGVYALASHDVKNDPLSEIAPMEEPLLVDDYGHGNSADDINKEEQQKQSSTAVRQRRKSTRANSSIAIQRHVRRASLSKRFTLNPQAYSESFRHKRLGSVLENEVMDTEEDQIRSTNPESKNQIGSTTTRTRGRTRGRTRTYSANVIGLGLA